MAHMRLGFNPRAITLGVIVVLLGGCTLGQTDESRGAKTELSPDNEQPALSTRINGPSNVAYSNGRLYVMEMAAMRILSVDVRLEKATLLLPAPIDPYTDDNTVLGSPFALTATKTGDVFIADVGGKLAEVALGAHTAVVKRTRLLEKFPQVADMAADPRDGTVLILDRHALLRWSPGSNELTKISGAYNVSGFSGDSGPAKDAIFNWPHGIAVDSRGNIFVADTENCRLRRIDAGTGLITTVAGGARCESSGDGGPAKAALLNNPSFVAVDSHGNIFLSERCRVRRIDSEGIISTYAGRGDCGFSGDGDLATIARVEAVGLAADEDGNLYIADYTHNRIRRIDSESHRITTLAGNGLPRRFDVQL
jgi:DNA-binding beta-propeller fold protein YncE